jgi:hypothetical protein
MEIDMVKEKEMMQRKKENGLPMYSVLHARAA